MNVGILGSGEVAQSLAAGFLQHGDAVMLGTRDPAKLEEWRAKSGERARVGTFAEAAAFGELVVLATLGTATEAAIAQAEAQNFNGKVVIDTTNPLRTGERGPELAWGFNDSNGERVQRALPDARIVKAFNTVGHGLFVHPKLPGGPPTMFVAGDDREAKTQVTSLLRAWGWESADIGAIVASRYLEPMCMAWVSYAVHNNDWGGHAFKLLRAS